MSFLQTGELIQSSSESDSPFLSKHNDSIGNSDSTQPSHCSPTTKSQQISDNKIKTKREVYKYETDWLVSSVAWCNDYDEPFELAVGSFIEEFDNQIHIVCLLKDSYDEEIVLCTSFDHPYPPTKISWIPKIPDSTIKQPRLIATSAECLRLWRLPPQPPIDQKTRHQNKIFINSNNNNDNSTDDITECDSTSNLSQDVKLECSLSPCEKANHRSSLTSFDWNEIDPRIIITSSIDTTCAVWDVEVGTKICHTNPMKSPTSGRTSYQLKNQILAHDHEVYDVSFSRQGSGREIFATAGGDGSLRLFDLRMLSTSTVLYETNDSCISANSNGRIGPALVRVACNKQDANYISTFSTSSKDVILIDIRKAGKPVAILSSHNECLNGISWAPHSSHHLCSASDDSQALIWDLSNMQEPTNDPLLAYRASGKINAINWSSTHPDWIAIGFENCLELLRV